MTAFFFYEERAADRNKDNENNSILLPYNVLV